MKRKNGYKKFIAEHAFIFGSNDWKILRGKKSLYHLKITS